MDLRTDQARAHYEEILAVAHEVVVGLDFDGTLAPIVEDPARAVIHPDAQDALVALAGQVRAVVVITGRPARQVVELGRLEELADRLPAGASLAVMGQYGHERWDCESREFTSPDPPEELQAFREELPGMLADEDAAEALVEEKGLAVAVHTRRLPHPKRTYARLERVLGEAARRHGLTLEPGRSVLEVRTPGMHKGVAVRTALEEHGGRGMVFVGDDLGDIEAFEAVRELRQQGSPALLVASSSEEQQALADRADVVVDGPDGVVAFLRELASASASG